MTTATTIKTTTDWGTFYATPSMTPGYVDIDGPDGEGWTIKIRRSEPDYAVMTRPYHLRGAIAFWGCASHRNVMGVVREANETYGVAVAIRLREDD